jgi:small basic protein (TIGR04137 family)
MSLHPSLRIDSASAQQRTVLTRIERIKDLVKKGKWQDGQNVVALPKTKILKIKATKTKAVKEGADATAAAATTTAKAATTTAKAATTTAAGKKPEKKK